MSAASLNRREALRMGGTAAAALLLAPTSRASAASWKAIPIGTQLWSVRKQLAATFPAR